MRTRILSHFALIFSLLFAQQAGFLHVLSHVPPASALRLQDPSQQSSAPSPEKAPHRTQACLQCLALTLSDGAVDARNVADAPAAPGTAPDVAAVPLSVRASPSPFLARAPPAIA